MCMCLLVCMCTPYAQYLQRLELDITCLKLELEVLLSHLMWVLGMDPRRSEAQAALLIVEMFLQPSSLKAEQNFYLQWQVEIYSRL